MSKIASYLAHKFLNFSLQGILTYGLLIPREYFHKSHLYIRSLGCFLRLWLLLVHFRVTYMLDTLKLA